MYASSYQPHKTGSCVLLLAVAFGLTVEERTAVAAPSPAERQAQSIVERGLEQMRNSQYAPALEAFKEAYDLWPTPALEARMGLAEQGLALWIDAERHLERALTASNDRFIVQNRKILERALFDVRKHLGYVHVVGSPPGATVKVDGITRGLLPSAGPVRVTEGQHIVEVSHLGFSAERRTLVVEPGKTLVLDIQLRVPDKVGPAAATVRVSAPPGEPGPATSGPVTTAEVATTMGQEARTEPRGRIEAIHASGSISATSNTLRTVAWLGTGLGVSMAVGGYLWHTSVTDRKEPLTVPELFAIGMTGLGAALALGGVEYLFFDWLLVPSSDGTQIGLAAGRHF